MAANKIINTTSLQVEIANGKDSNGNTTYKKKTFSNINVNASSQDIYDVATAIKGVLGVSTRDFYIADSSKLVDEQ
ncbi:MAG: DUF1659 domain-containing protein [Clostridium sp.]|nr:DUF1659 domain-containing protein [Clostridium sp.]